MHPKAGPGNATLLSVLAALALGACGVGEEPNTGSSGSQLQAQWTDFPAKSHRPTRDAVTGVTEKYFGGPIVPNPKVYVVWWGSAASINANLTRTTGGIADFFAGTLNTGYWDMLNEYSTNINAQAGSHVGQAGTGQFLGRGNYARTIAMTNIPTGTLITDAQIQAAINTNITSGVLPQPDDNTIYAIYFPSSVSINLSGSRSCSAFGAYHEAVIRSPSHNAWYLVMPDCGYSFASWTNVSSHELVEAATDAIPTPGSNPDYPQAWNDSSGNEIGDLCQSSSGTIATPKGSFTVQGQWDERTQGCKITSFDANDFNVAFSTNTSSLTVGAATNFAVTTAVSSGSAQSLTLSVVAPAGVTATVSPASVTAGGSATVTVTASAAVVDQQVVVQAQSPSGQVHTAALLINAGTAPANDFAISASPTSLALQAGGASGTSTIATSIVAGSGTVALAVSGAPAGVTATLNPTSVAAGGSATLTVSAGAAAAAGSYTLTITGTEGTATHATTVALTVTTTTGTTLVSDGFESGGWTATQVSGTAGAWSIVTKSSHPTGVSPHGTSRMARFNSYTSAAGSQTRYARTATVAIPTTATAVTLKFWMYHDTGFSTSADKVQAQVAVAGVWSNVGAAVNRYSGATGWAQATVDLTAYKGKTIQLGFLGISAFGNDEYLDDVTITAQ